MVEQVQKKLSENDRRVLLLIYEHRCLREDLIHKYVYAEENIKRGFAIKRLERLIEAKLIECIDYDEEFPALFLTNSGIRIVRELFPREIASLTKKENQKLTAADLRIVPVNINHQMHLNRFALEMRKALRDVPHKYYDEKYMPVTSQYMMADGMIELDDRILLLETDMGTERAARFAQKWDSYRSFLQDKGEHYRNKKIEMYFILEGMKRPAQRILTVTQSLMSYLSVYVGIDFEVFINTPEELKEVILNNLNRKQMESTECLREQGFLVSHSEFLKTIDLPNAAYIRKLTEQRKIQIVNGKPQEYIVEDWNDGRISVLKNLMYFQQISAKIKTYAKRKIPYVVIVPSEKNLNKLLRTMNILQPEDLYFTTKNRLQGNSWAAALFRFDQLGNLSHYKDADLKEQIHERRFAI